MTKQSKRPARRFRANVDLSYPTDERVIARLLAGENLPESERTNKDVDRGEIVDDIPACSVPWLLEAGAIEEVKS